MIKVDYEVDNNVPPDKEIILFDRNAFQQLSKDALIKITKRYNILCPIHFVIECISPNNSDKKDKVFFEKEKKFLREKLELIKNPIVFMGRTNIGYRIQIPSYIKETEYIDILDSWQIARNCIIDDPVIMKSITHQELVSRCEVKLRDLKYERRVSTDTIDYNKGSLSPNRYRSNVKKRSEQIYDNKLSMSELKRRLRSTPATNITQELSNAAGHALREIKDESKDEILEYFKSHFFLTAVDIKGLSRKLRQNRNLTIENYPSLSYPIYIYFLIRYMLCARQQDAQHLDNSYFIDFKYLHYLNFCDRFIANETSTPHIVNAIPYSDIRSISIITSEELKKN